MQAVSQARIWRKSGLCLHYRYKLSVAIEFSHAIESDLFGIFCYSFEQFGSAGAECCKSRLKNSLQVLFDKSWIARLRHEIISLHQSVYTLSNST